jgi:hypothetical protein
VALYASYDSCSNTLGAARVYRVVSTASTLYLKSGASCVAYPVPAAYTGLKLGAEEPPSSFVAFTKG